MVNVEDFLKIEDPYHENPDKIRDMRLEVIKKAAKHHFKNCAQYKKICRKNDFNPSKDLKSYDDVVNIPWITSKSFKKSYNLYKSLISVPEDKISVWYQSSGTSGDASMVGRDTISDKRYFDFGQKDARLLFNIKMFKKGIVFGPSIKFIRGLTFAVGMKVWTEGMCEDAVYLMTEKREEGKIPINVDLTIKSIMEASKTQDVYMFGGSPALAYFTLKKIYENTGRPFNLANSYAAGFGGGWKSFAGQAISKDQFRKEVSEILGVPYNKVRDNYGLTESDVSFHECEELVFHVPPWADVIMRDPQTMVPVKEGEKGLVNIINPLSTSWPGISILLDDVAILINEKKCKCGRYGKTFQNVERAVGADARGCGAMIADLAGE